MRAAKPCVLCGTRGGSVQLGRAAPRRVRGLCSKCLKIDNRPPPKSYPLTRQPGDPTPWEIALAEIAIRFKARGQARVRFRRAERPGPVEVLKCHASID